jgi:hypothetical protein
MFFDESEQLSHWRLLGGLNRELMTELGLPAGTPHEHYEPARNRCRNVVTEVFLDEGKGEIDARGHACRRPNVSVSHVDRIGFDLDLWKALREVGAEGPVRGRATTIEKSGAREYKSSGADRGQPARARRNSSDGSNDAGALACLSSASPAGQHQSVDVNPPATSERGVREDRQPALGANRVARDADDRWSIPRASAPRTVQDLVRKGKHLERANYVQRVARIERDDDDRAGHRTMHIVAGSACWRKDDYQTF